MPQTTRRARTSAAVSASVPRASRRNVPHGPSSSTRDGLRPPAPVRRAAKLGQKLVAAGFAGGTPTGWRRAEQLATHNVVPVSDVAVMRTWYARHGPDARNGGTSYPGYRRWVADGRPTRATGTNRDQYRGAVAWLIWGGDAAYEWLKTPQVRKALREAYPNRKEALDGNRLATHA